MESLIILLLLKSSLGSKNLNKTDFITRTLMDKKKENALGQVIRIAILGWSAALLTASYAGALSKMDPTFIATVFTASAATFGINTMKKGGEDDEKKEEPRREAVVEAPPEPPAPEAPATTLEARVEALEEGQVQPRTGGA
jgi:hypothetical protein